jgi:hypothetical protein
MLDWRPVILTEIFCNIPLLFQVNTRTVLQIVIVLVTIEGALIGNQIY